MDVFIFLLDTYMATTVGPTQQKKVYFLTGINECLLTSVLNPSMDKASFKFNMC